MNKTPDFGQAVLSAASMAALPVMPPGLFNIGKTTQVRAGRLDAKPCALMGLGRRPPSPTGETP